MKVRSKNTGTVVNDVPVVEHVFEAMIDGRPIQVFQHKGNPDVPDVITPTGTPLVEIVTRWNDLALDYETGLEVNELDRASTWDRVSLELTTDQFGMFTEAHLQGDPLGDGQSDRRILVAMGQLVGSVDATLDGPARRSLLAELGLDIGAPQIHLLDGSTSRNGITYELWYDATGPMIHLRASSP